MSATFAPTAATSHPIPLVACVLVLALAPHPALEEVPATAYEPGIVGTDSGPPSRIAQADHSGRAPPTR
ncbi:hypothetical protein OP10G_0426 [Fimbriimonas ginsengisoli Gsoil 348]|uniref:Secreted protein n=1 Tax=Fimbriimonas ginsengisoli Gsoil 348 TaxID=661478 RepID=A0A068NQA0_FIMGI|nr:hypothetical protein OP10G_0426 [Fimbriimonas ginsengisoli Gsoil 348]